jgi:hypothetical protein
VRILLKVGDEFAVATLANNPTASDFVTLLPLTLSMGDLFRHEKPGALPRRLDTGGEAVFTYDVGQLGYWAPGGDLAIVYAVSGDASIPHPGLIPLGSVDSGLDVIAGAGDAFELRIEVIE